MSEPYAPTTEDVRNEYTGFGESGMAEFDRWLAEHDRQVAERAWDEGWADRHGLPENRVLLTRDGRARNPYRAAKGEQK